MLRDRQFMVLNLLKGQRTGNSHYHKKQDHQHRCHYFSIPQKL